MADEIIRKRVTLHPSREDGSVDNTINLYPKTFLDGIVDRQGEQVEVATKAELNEKQDALTAGENITIEDNVISAAGGKSFGEYITLEPIVYEEGNISFSLSNSDYDDILNNSYPFIKIRDCSELQRVAFELRLTGEGKDTSTNQAWAMYESTWVDFVYRNINTVTLYLDRFINQETLEVDYLFECSKKDAYVSVTGERYTTQRIHQAKEFYNDETEARTKIDFGRVELHRADDISSLEIESDRSKDEFTKMPGLRVNGKYEEDSTDHNVWYDVTFPDMRDSSSIQGKLNVVALEETIPTFAIIRDPITNLNGRVLTEYTYTELPLPPYPSYLIRHINSQTHEEEILTIDQARLYMKRMTGTAFVPEYNFINPRNSLFITAAGEFLKPQFDAQNGLELYKIPNPFALKTDTGTKLYEHHITIIRSGNSPIEMWLITNKCDEFSMDNLDIGTLISGKYQSKNDVLNCTIPIKPFPGATFISVNITNTLTIDSATVLSTNTVTITPVEITDVVTAL